MSAVRGVTAVALAAGIFLAGCSASDDASKVLGSRQWGTITVTVETSPSPPRPGTNEILVQVSGERHQAVFDALVYVRTRVSHEWTQAIQDGHVGVYRRALNFGRGGDVGLEILLRRNGEEATLVFPVEISGAT